MSLNDKIICPLVDKEIKPIDCMENRDLKESSIPEEYKEKKDWRKICEKCKYYDY